MMEVHDAIQYAEEEGDRYAASFLKRARDTYGLEAVDLAQDNGQYHVDGTIADSDFTLYGGDQGEEPPHVRFDPAGEEILALLNQMNTAEW